MGAAEKLEAVSEVKPSTTTKRTSMSRWHLIARDRPTGEILHFEGRTQSEVNKAISDKTDLEMLFSIRGRLSRIQETRKVSFV